MLRFVNTNLFESPAQTIVNTVNTVGVMGKGIAKDFKARFPDMYREYKHYCDSRELAIGALHVWRGQSKWVLNFPTKTTWKLPSKLDYIEHGLRTFREHYPQLGIRSIAFPPLGCGNGNLDWQDVRPIMVQYLHKLDIPIWIHEKLVDPTFLPEQTEYSALLAPATFDEFLKDLYSIVMSRSGVFKCWGTKAPFRAEPDDDGLSFFTDQKFHADGEALATAWAGLKLGVLTPEQFGFQQVSMGHFLLPVLSELPYVRSINARSAAGYASSDRTGLYFNQAIEGAERKPARLVA